MRVRRSTVVGSITALVLTLGGLAYVAAPADAGDGQVFVGVSKRPNGEWHTNLSPNIKRGQAKDFYIEVINVSLSDLEVSLSGVTEGPELRAKWFKGVSGNRNITEAVTEGDYSVNTKSGQVKKFRWLVKRTNDPGTGVGCSRTLATWPIGNDDTVGIFVNGSPGGCLI